MSQRREPCVCGGVIVAPSLHGSAEFVLAHNQTAQHAVWRGQTALRELALELVPTGLPDYDDPRRERPTAGLSPRDVSLATVRASAAASGGRP